MKQAQQMVVQFKKGKETNRKPYEVKGEEVKNTVMDSIAMRLERDAERQINRAIKRKADFEEIKIWVLQGEVKKATKKKTVKPKVDE